MSRVMGWSPTSDAIACAIVARLANTRLNSVSPSCCTIISCSGTTTTGKAAFCAYNEDGNSLLLSIPPVLIYILIYQYLDININIIKVHIWYPFVKFTFGKRPLAKVIFLKITHFSSQAQAQAH